MSKYVELIGPVSWAKVFEETRDMKGPPGSDYASHGGKTSIDIYIDADQYKTLKLAGSKKQLKVDDEGNTFVTLDRKWEAPYTYGGAPQVLHADGKTVWTIDEDGLIGNGSKCAVVASVYEAGGFTGTRLDTVQVIDHIPYETDFDPERDSDRPQPKDYTKGKAKPKASTQKKAQKNAEVVDDEIPF